MEFTTVLNRLSEVGKQVMIHAIERSKEKGWVKASVKFRRYGCFRIIRIPGIRNLGKPENS